MTPRSLPLPQWPLASPMPARRAKDNFDNQRPNDTQDSKPISNRGERKEPLWMIGESRGVWCFAEMFKKRVWVPWWRPRKGSWPRRLFPLTNGVPLYHCTTVLLSTAVPTVVALLEWRVFEIRFRYGSRLLLQRVLGHRNRLERTQSHSNKKKKHASSKHSSPKVCPPPSNNSKSTPLS